ncbi:hypothetical protein KC19_1G182000 [Ceratodon purpureus]|uniref:Uncharacterized protein n=1 Tax=Ceratodon purpureus TaxID=3225 RepID=A0A8T0J7N0_CERPU|nr:hypothetical protein KC19_1G182000 [Ceratodon purpureus]
MTSLSHSAVLLSLSTVRKVPRQRDRKNLCHAREPASPAIAPARPLPPQSAPPLMPSALAEGTGPGSGVRSGFFILIATTTSVFRICRRLS